MYTTLRISQMNGILLISKKSRTDSKMTTASACKPRVSIIVAALVPKYGIGNKGQLPWRLKTEMKYFRQVTTNTVDPNKRNVVIMGRKTWESIPVKFRPLPERINVILTRSVQKYQEEFKDELQKCNQSGHEPMLHIAESIEHALDGINLNLVEEVFIIGGAEIYNQTLKPNESQAYPVDRLLLTEVRHEDQKTSDEIEMDAFIKFDTQIWEKRPSESLSAYLASKNLSKEYQLENNMEKGFIYDFTLWEKR